MILYARCFYTSDLAILSRGAPAHLALNLFGKFVLGTLQIVLHLETKPEIGRSTEILREPKRRVRRNGALAFHISRIRFGATCRSSASWLMLLPWGAMKSSRRSAPRLLRARLNVALNLHLVVPRCDAQIVAAL